MELRQIQAFNMVPDILRKLKDVVDAGITTEVQTVYFVALIRKLMERENEDAFPYLRFYCNWALHAKLTNKTAQGILQEFEKEHLRLKGGLSLDELPNGMRAQIDKISKMHLFREELNGYLSYYGLPNIGADRDGWSKFMYCYAHVIKDCPLEIKMSDESSTIESVTVDVEDSVRDEEGEHFYRVSWIITDKDRETGRFEIYNSYSANS